MIIALGTLALSAAFSQAAPPAPPAPPPAPPTSSRPATGQPAPAPGTTPVPGDGRMVPERGAPNRGTRPVSPGTTAPVATPPAPVVEPPVGDDGMVDGPPPIQAEPAVLDFGYIAPSAESKGTFKLWNRGTKPITVLAIQPSCKCTTTNDLADTQIKPGEFAELEAGLDGAPLPGPRKANIKVLVDGYSRVIELEIKAEVAYPLRAPPGYLNVVKGQEQKGRLFVESIDKKPFRICHVHGEPPEYIGFDPALDAPRSQYLIRWDITKYGDKIPPYWIIVSDREDCPILPIRVRHESTIPRPVFRLKEYSVNLGAMEPGKPIEVVVDMEDPLEPIVAVATDDARLRAELLSTELDNGNLRARIRVTPRPDADGLVTLPLSIYSNSKEMTIPAFGIVRSSGKTGCDG